MDFSYKRYRNAVRTDRKLHYVYGTPNLSLKQKVKATNRIYKKFNKKLKKIKKLRRKNNEF